MLCGITVVNFLPGFDFSVIRIPVEDLTNSEQTILKLLEGIFIFMKEV